MSLVFESYMRSLKPLPLSAAPMGLVGLGFFYPSYIHAGRSCNIPSRTALPLPEHSASCMTPAILVDYSVVLCALAAYLIRKRCSLIPVVAVSTFLRHH
jgi:hypothetical protein